MDNSLEPRLSVLDFVSQLWRKTDFSPKLQDKIRNGKPGFEARWVMSKCTQDLQKVCTKLFSLPDNAKKLNF